MHTEIGCENRQYKLERIFKQKVDFYSFISLALLSMKGVPFKAILMNDTLNAIRSMDVGKQDLICLILFPKNHPPYNLGVSLIRLRDSIFDKL